MRREKRLRSADQKGLGFQSELVRIAEVAVGKAVQESEARQTIEARGNGRDAHDSFGSFRSGGFDPRKHGCEVVCPEQSEPSRLCIFEIVSLINSAKHCDGNDLRCSEVMMPSIGFHGGIVVESLDRVRCGIGSLALDWHNA